MKDINWKEIQEFYNDNHTWFDITKHYKLTGYTIMKGIKLGLLKLRSKSDANKLAHVKNPQKHTEETKKKISEIRIKYLQENPDKVPYLLNHHSKGESYPEKYFNEILEKTNLKYERYFRIGLYELDFAFLNKKIDLEIDGEQHCVDLKIVNSDIKRDKFMKDNGWDIIRINWKKYQRFIKEEKIIFIEKLINHIENKDISNFKPTYKIDDNLKRKKYFCECGNLIYIKGKSCNKCSRIKSRKVKRPSVEILLEDVNKIGYEGTGRKYKVSGNNIKKWLKQYNVIPPRKQGFILQLAE